jgi:hypothetical protein
MVRAQVERSRIYPEEYYPRVSLAIAKENLIGKAEWLAVRTRTAQHRLVIVISSFSCQRAT